VVNRYGCAAMLCVLLMAGCSSAVTGSGRGRGSLSSAVRSTLPPVRGTLPPVQSSLPPVQSTLPPTAPPSSSAPTGPSPVSLLARFAGQWFGHGRGLTFSPSGRGLITYRIYTFCRDDPTPPCDELHGNQIIDGGRIVLVLRTAFAAGKAVIAEGSVVSSTDTTMHPGDSVIARLHAYLLTLLVGTSGAFSFCSPNAPPGACGA
jgi:hypothetical protein